VRPALSCDCTTYEHSNWTLTEAPQNVSLKRKRTTRAPDASKLPGRTTSVGMKKDRKQKSAKEKEDDYDSDF